MVEKKLPQEPINISTIECDTVIFGIRRTVLKISPHCWERNEEFRQSKKKKVRKNLNQYLLDKKVIRDLVQQIHKEDIRFEGINKDWPAWKYYACENVIDYRNNLIYQIVFFLDDNNPENIGVITVYPYE